MKLALRKTTTAVAAFATVGVSGLFLGAAPASAATETCGPTGTLVSPGICELVFTESGNFVRTAEMTTLEVLLVGGGGDAAIQPRSSGEPAPSNGYAAAGGGGEVRVVDFSDAAGQVDVYVGDSNVDDTEIEDLDGGLFEEADNGDNGTGGSIGFGNGGASGSGLAGQPFTHPSQNAYGGGGGAGSIGLGNLGGTGVAVNSLVLAGSLFASVSSCYGGGGGAGFVTTVEPITSVMGGASCGGGLPTDSTATALVAPVANTGGGAGAVNFAVASGAEGARGLVVVRWPAQQVLAATGSETNGTAMTIGISALVAGIVLAMAAAYTRKRRTN